MDFFNKNRDNPDFREDSVREAIILPILKQLGYEYEKQNIIRSKVLLRPFLKVGSNRKVAIKLIPDYVFKVGEILRGC